MATESSPLLPKAKQERCEHLLKNLECQQVNLHSNGTVTFQGTGEAQHHDPEHQLHLKIVSYDTDFGINVLCMWTGTQWANVEIWWICSMYWMLSCTIIAGLYALHTDPADTGVDVQPSVGPEDLEALADLTKYTSTVVAFMTGLFVSSMVSRWWEMRKLVGKLLCASHDLVSRISSRLADPISGRKYVDRVIRLSCLSHRLIYNQAQKLESEEDLQLHVDSGLMTHEELQALIDAPCKPQIVWTWISRLFFTLYSTKKLDDIPAPVLARFDGIFSDASNAIHDIFMYIETQVPFPYVHLLYTMVVLNNLLIAVKCSCIIGCAKDFDSGVLAIEVLHVFLVPFAYHSFLAMGFELSNPFGSDPIDMPGYTIGVLARDEILACVEAGFSPPSTILDDVLEEAKSA